MAKKQAAQTATKQKRPAKRRVRKPKEASPPERVSQSGGARLRTVGLALMAFGVGIIIGVLLAGGLQFNVGPGPSPGPAPAPTPEPVKSLRVIFVKESGATLNADQTAIPGAKEIREYLDAKTTKEGDQSGWREFDPRQVTTNEQQTMKALWEAVKPKLLPAPCLVVEVNGHAKVLPFPANVAECMSVLKKAAGE